MSSPQFSTFRMVFMLSLALSLASCAPIVPIADVQTQPLDQSIQVKGKVITLAPMINQTAYELQDDRGTTVWILNTRKTGPKVGDEVTVSGKVKFESIPVDGQELGEKYLEEG
jgi:RecJ-like exonuclease